MKKILFILVILTSVFLVNDLSKNNIVIPKESIRFRVIANSNSLDDQEIKYKVKNALETELSKDIKSDINLTRDNINSNIDLYKNIINTTLKDNNCNSNYSINYGLNYFPKKEYKGVTYEEGEYESLVVKLGNGEGKNFWCVLFPPLCFIDEKETNDVEYHFIIKDILNKFKSYN